MASETNHLRTSPVRRPALGLGGLPANDSLGRLPTPGSLGRTPSAVARAVVELCACGRLEQAGSLAQSALFAWAADEEREPLREAFALLAHEELPRGVVRAIAAVAFTVRGEVLGAEWWVRRARGEGPGER